jgi:MFS family permease
MVAMGWEAVAQVWASGLLVMAVVFLLLTREDPDHLAISVLGFFMSLGMAAVFEYIPAYYPNHVGAVGGLVGMIGGLGGFVLPLAFGVLSDLTGIWTSCLALLFTPRVGGLRLDARRHPADGAACRAARDAGHGRARGRRSAPRRPDRGLAARGRRVLGHDGPPCSRPSRRSAPARRAASRSGPASAGT